jgi:hypothetical protein
MSFATMDKPELLDVAEIFGVEIDDTDKTEKDIIIDLLSDGITYEMYVAAKTEGDVELANEIVSAPEPEPVIEVEETVKTTQKFKSKNARELLKMERWNPTFNILGYRFEKEHPFVLVTPDEASWIMSHEEGFRLATPEEAQEFYKR